MFTKTITIKSTFQNANVLSDDKRSNTNDMYVFVD